MGRVLLKAIFAGLMIGIGCTVCLICPNNIVGTFLFSVGLFTILVYEFQLYTGTVGYLVYAKSKIKFVFNLIIVWTGNFLGCLIYVAGLKTINIETTINLSVLYTTKISQPFFSILFLSIMCGLLMFIAVDNYKNNESTIGKYLGIFLCVSTFIFCKFEHSIANMFYMLISNEGLFVSVKAFIFVLICTLGNGIGGILIPVLKLNKIENKRRMNK